MAQRKTKESREKNADVWGIVLVVVLSLIAFWLGFLIPKGLVVHLNVSPGVSLDKPVNSSITSNDNVLNLDDTLNTDLNITDVTEVLPGTEFNGLQEPGTAPAKTGNIALNKSSVKEVVEYYNTSANRVKSVPAKSLTWVYEDITLDKDYTEIPKALVGLMGLVNSALKTDNKNETYTTKEGISEVFAVERETWSSKLPSEAIKEYSCKEENGNYKIKLVLKDEPNANVKHGEGYAGNAFYVYSVDQIKRGPVEDVKIKYHDCTIECTIDKKTGNMKDAKYIMPAVMDIKSMGMSAKVGITIEKYFTMEW